MLATCADPAGKHGTPTPPLKNHKNIGFLSNIGPNPRKITKLPNQLSMFGQHRHASETPFKWRFAGWADDGPHIVVFGSSFPSSKYKQQKKVKVRPPLTKLSGSAHALEHWIFNNIRLSFTQQVNMQLSYLFNMPLKCSEM